jgi:hypothetical protein
LLNSFLIFNAFNFNFFKLENLFPCVNLWATQIVLVLKFAKMVNNVLARLDIKETPQAISVLRVMNNETEFI